MTSPINTTSNDYVVKPADSSINVNLPTSASQSVTSAVNSGAVASPTQAGQAEAELQVVQSGTAGSAQAVSGVDVTSTTLLDPNSPTRVSSAASSSSSTTSTTPINLVNNVNSTTQADIDASHARRSLNNLQGKL